MDACDDVPRVAFVVVMIRSELDPSGLSARSRMTSASTSPSASYRNGTTVAVTETADFAAIIQRRLFENAGKPLPAAELARSYMMAADANWRDKVFEKLGPNRTLTGFGSGSRPIIRSTLS